jgi:two-component system NtrC family response regulator
MQRALDSARALGMDDHIAVLISEPGSGAERMARAIHELAIHRPQPLVAIDVSLLPDPFERHIREVFTRAAQGAVLLHNIDRLPVPRMEVLPPVLQRFEARGASRGVAHGVRVFVTRTPALLPIPQASFTFMLVQSNLARPAHVPALRHRVPDIPDLVEVLLDELCDERQRGPCTVTSDALDSLERYQWQENVRELKQVLRRALITAGDDRFVDIEHLPRRIRAASEPSSDADLTLAELERRHVLATLTRLGGHREATARALGISVSTLARRLQEYGDAAQNGGGNAPDFVNMK